jgi:hypothetical protein
VTAAPRNERHSGAQTRRYASWAPIALSVSWTRNQMMQTTRCRPRLAGHVGAALRVGRSERCESGADSPASAEPILVQLESHWEALAAAEPNPAKVGEFAPTLAEEPGDRRQVRNGTGSNPRRGLARWRSTGRWSTPRLRTRRSHDQRPLLLRARLCPTPAAIAVAPLSLLTWTSVRR